MSSKKLPIYNLIEQAKGRVRLTQVNHVITGLENIAIYTNQKNYKYLITIKDEIITVLDSEGKAVISNETGELKVSNLPRNSKNRKSKVIDTIGETED